MKKVLVIFSLALIQGCLVSNKEFEELDSDSSFFTSAQSIKCMPVSYTHLTLPTILRV